MNDTDNSFNLNNISLATPNILNDIIKFNLTWLNQREFFDLHKLATTKPKP